MVSLVYAPNGAERSMKMLADAIARILELASQWLPEQAITQIMNLLG